MFAAYIDESFDGNRQGIYAVAGVIARTAEWFEIERSWMQLAGTQVIKASRLGVVERKRYLDVLLLHNLFAVGAVIQQSDFYSIFRNEGKLSWADLRKSPYHLAYQQTFINVAYAFRKSGLKRSIAVVCDHSHRYSPYASNAYETFKRKNKKSSEYMGSFELKEDSNCIPLQVADLVAYELRLTARQKLLGKGEPRFFLENLSRSGRLGKCSIYDQSWLRKIDKLVKESRAHADS